MLVYIFILLIAAITGFVLFSSVNKSKYLVLSIISVIIGALLVYFYLGKPDYTDQPYVNVQLRKKQLQSLSTDQLIENYENNLYKNDTPKARITLANILMRLGRFQQAEMHFKAAYDLNKGQSANIIIAYAESIIAQDQNQINPQALDLIHQALEKQAEHPKALFYQGIYYAQAQKTSQAIAVWKNLIKLAQGQPYEKIMRQNLRAAIDKLKIDPQDLGLRPKAAIREITKDDLGMIENMVKSLEQKAAENPDDAALQKRLSGVRMKFKEIQAQFKN